MKVMCIKNTPIRGDRTFSMLTKGRVYTVFGIEGNWYRIIDDGNEPCLFSPKRFKIVEAFLPPDWISEVSDGELSCYPKEINRIGFFEDYFDGDRKAIEIFREIVKKIEPDFDTDKLGTRRPKSFIREP